MKQKLIIFLSFYFEPDLGAGSFRNTSLLKELSKNHNENTNIVVFTSLPNRYRSFNKNALEFEEFSNVKIYRVKLPLHNNGFLDQIYSFYSFYSFVIKKVKIFNYDLVFASSSRLFTAFLGYKIAKKRNKPLYLDIRDIFVDTISDVIKNKILKFLLIPILRLFEFNVFNYATHINLISYGFKDYFLKFKKVNNFTFFTNGIDDEFFKLSQSKLKNKTTSNSIKTILYAGNIGEGQGLHNIIPKAAKLLNGKYKFKVIGDGGTKNKLIKYVNANKISNVEINPPINRSDLIQEYINADFLFIHLNNYQAFDKVLPSKIFELSVFNKPIIAGVGGYCANFIKKNVNNSIVFSPGNEIELVNMLSNFIFDTTLNRRDFINKYKRKNINKNMSHSIVSYLKCAI
tara:strand:- start:3835 stop:5037 length:1203 start_codon:yes stop_codon:yes gene_type:complete